jgi:hypothetical protein
VFCFEKLALNEGKTNGTSKWNGDEGDRIEEGREEGKEGETKLAFQDSPTINVNQLGAHATSV